MSSFMFWRSVQEAAEIEASASPLPGFYDGPADAYRHIIGTAELRRRFGWATAYSIATGNEVLGTHLRNHPAHLRRMDDHNNAIGLAIGAEARSYDDVVRLAREAIDRGIGAGGSGQDGTPLGDEVEGALLRDVCKGEYPNAFRTQLFRFTNVMPSTFAT